MSLRVRDGPGPSACAHGRLPNERCPWCQPSTAVTRHEAEVAIKPSACAALREQVLACVKAHPGRDHRRADRHVHGPQLRTTARPREAGESEKAGRIVLRQARPRPVADAKP